MVNVTPSTPPALPIQYTTNYGQVFILSGVQGFGCVDTVYSTTYNGTAYLQYTVLPADQALAVVQQYAYQFGYPAIACNSLIQNANLISSSTVRSQDLVVLGIDFGAGAGGWVTFVIAIVVTLFALDFVWEHLGRRRRG